MFQILNCEEKKKKKKIYLSLDVYKPSWFPAFSQRKDAFTPLLSRLPLCS